MRTTTTDRQQSRRKGPRTLRPGALRMLRGLMLRPIV